MKFFIPTHFPQLSNGPKAFIVLLFSLVALTTISCKTQQKLPDPLAAGWEGKSVCEVLEENEKLRTLKCSFPPGVGHDKHYHPLHFGYTLAGSKFRITDTTGTRDVQVPTGSHFYNDKIQWHQVVNIGDSTAVFLIMEPK